MRVPRGNEEVREVVTARVGRRPESAEDGVEKRREERICSPRKGGRGLGNLGSG